MNMYCYATILRGYICCYIIGYIWCYITLIYSYFFQRGVDRGEVWTDTHPHAHLPPGFCLGRVRLPWQQSIWWLERKICEYSLRALRKKKATTHQVTTMLATSRDFLFPGYNLLLTTVTDEPSLAGAQAIIKVSGHQHRWLAGGYDWR